MISNWQGCHPAGGVLFAGMVCSTLYRRLGSRAFSSVAVVSCCLLRSVRKVALTSCCCSQASSRSADWSVMSADSGAERRNELSYSLVRVVGLIKPRPPRRAGRARSSLSSSVGASRPVRYGRKSRRIVSSSGCNRGAKPSMVCRRYVHRLMRPWVRAAKAAWVQILHTRRDARVRISRTTLSHEHILLQRTKSRAQPRDDVSPSMLCELQYLRRCLQQWQGVPLSLSTMTSNC